ncbi:hypothetical protein T265_01407 [Opisthorchis viverrini]|uniref:Uncharacterized protein n=1 Tax=Opisthorchis viverrini TaxID=6198 RepID=A0A075A9U6_OPIVI|nr:hypothetical protein T265_01407 [Opisthorchis viverrini]KER32530.1 hypothetical protein T265_01407 [Opisthorchis viverrini]
MKRGLKVGWNTLLIRWLKTLGQSITGSNGRRGLRVSVNLMLYLNPNCTKSAGSLVQHIQLLKNVMRKFSWAPTAVPPEGSTRAGILPGCPSLDRGSREAGRVRTTDLPVSKFAL